MSMPQTGGEEEGMIPSEEAIETLRRTVCDSAGRLDMSFVLDQLISAARRAERLDDENDILRSVARNAEVLVKRIFARVNFEAATTDVCEALRAAGIEV